MSLIAGSRGRAVALALCFATLSGCVETALGVHFIKSAARTVDSASGPGGAPAASAPIGGAQTDVALAPGEFFTTGTAVWDGAETPEGVWIAHPHADRAERVRVRNIATGESVDSALFHRDPSMPGPPIVVSSDAARALGLTPGVPAELEVTALESAASPAAERQVAATDRTKPPVPPPPAPIEAPELAANAAAPPRARPAGTPSPATSRQKYLQVGSFGVEANAAALIGRLRADGQPTRQIARAVGGRPMSIVLIGPLASDAAVAAAREAAAAEGISDAIEVTQ